METKSLYWIIGPVEEADELRALGCTLGPRDAAEKLWTGCTLDLPKMDPNWGRWFWGPEPTRHHENPTTNLNAELARRAYGTAAPIEHAAERTVVATNDGALTDAEWAYIEGGRKILAVKSVRDRLGLGLLAAIDLVKRVQAQRKEPTTLPCGHPVTCLRLLGSGDEVTNRCGWCATVQERDEALAEAEMLLKTRLDLTPAQTHRVEVAGALAVFDHEANSQLRQVGFRVERLRAMLVRSDRGTAEVNALAVQVRGLHKLLHAHVTTFGKEAPDEHRTD